MAEVRARRIGESFNVTLTEGKRINIRILNADGSVAQVMCDDAIPTGETMAGQVSYFGNFGD